MPSTSGSAVCLSGKTHHEVPSQLWSPLRRQTTLLWGGDQGKIWRPGGLRLQGVGNTRAVGSSTSLLGSAHLGRLPTPADAGLARWPSREDTCWRRSAPCMWCCPNARDSRKERMHDASNVHEDSVLWTAQSKEGRLCLTSIRTSRRWRVRSGPGSTIRCWFGEPSRLRDHRASRRRNRAWHVGNRRRHCCGRFSFHTLEGLKTSGNDDLHITSTRFDEPMCLSLLGHSAVVVTSTGKTVTMTGDVFVGGLDRIWAPRSASP